MMGVRRLGSLLIAAMVAAGCVAASPPGWTAPPSLGPVGTGLAAGSASDGARPAITPDPSVTFAGAPLTLPPGWLAAHYDNPSSFFSLNDYLGPEVVPDPCTRTANSMSCGYWPAIQLPANGILVSTWYMGGPPGNVPDMSVGEAVSVAGRAGRLAIVEVDAGCRSMGGDEQLRIIVPSEAIWNWEQLSACLRGPDHGAGEAAVRALIGGLPTASQVPMETAATYRRCPGRTAPADSRRCPHSNNGRFTGRTAPNVAAGRRF